MIWVRFPVARQKKHIRATESELLRFRWESKGWRLSGDNPGPQGIPGGPTEIAKTACDGGFLCYFGRDYIVDGIATGEYALAMTGSILLHPVFLFDGGVVFFALGLDGLLGTGAELLEVFVVEFTGAGEEGFGGVE